MAICFVIQPFDAARFDKRYNDTFKPAIEAAGLEPYRVDRDPRAEIPIQEIEAGIRRADVCFAEISTDNPNVWFELGYAIAAKKPVVMVSDEDRDRFPFDVQHRRVIRYTSEAPSDFDRLGDEISSSLRAAVERKLELDEIADRSPLAETEGLSQHEIVGLVAVAAGGSPPGAPVAAYSVGQDMARSGFTEVAVTLAIRALRRKGMIREVTVEAEYSDYLGLGATDAGLDWLEENQERLILHREENSDKEDDLPF